MPHYTTIFNRHNQSQKPKAKRRRRRSTKRRGK